VCNTLARLDLVLLTTNPENFPGEFQTHNDSQNTTPHPGALGRRHILCTHTTGRLPFAFSRYIYIFTTSSRKRLSFVNLITPALLPRPSHTNTFHQAHQRKRSSETQLVKTSTWSLPWLDDTRRSWCPVCHYRHFLLGSHKSGLEKTLWEEGRHG
jgi:hypothetical protein